MVLSMPLEWRLSFLISKMNDNTCEDQQYACRASAEIGKWGCPINGYFSKLYFVQSLSRCAVEGKRSGEKNVKPNHTKSAYLALTSILQHCLKLFLSVSGLSFFIYNREELNFLWQFNTSTMTKSFPELFPQRRKDCIISHSENYVRPQTLGSYTVSLLPALNEAESETENLVTLFFFWLTNLSQYFSLLISNWFYVTT